MGCHIGNLSKRWPSEGIPFEINPNVGAPLRLTIQGAVAAWNAATFPPFVPRSEQDDYVEFVMGNKCASPVGRQSGNQNVSCTTGADVRALLHEMGHAAGLFHEQSCSDRDDYVGINAENIIPSARHNFEIAGGSVNVLGYDFASIMHYGRNFFAFDSAEPTLFFPRTAPPPASLFSAGDLATLASLYSNTRFILETGTPLEQTGPTWAFCLDSDNSLFAIKKSGTGSHSTEVHVLSADSDYREFSLHTGTPLEETDATFQFCLASNRDLFAIKKSGTGSHSTEVHVLSADSDYREFSLHTSTPLEETNATFQFCLAPNRDLFAIKKSGTGTHTTEVHILTESSGYQDFGLHTATLLAETDDAWVFELNSSRDLFGIKMFGTGTGSTEIHIIDLP